MPASWTTPRKLNPFEIKRLIYKGDLDGSEEFRENMGRWFAIGEMVVGNTPTFDTGSVLGILFLGAGANAAAFALWNISLKHVDATVERLVALVGKAGAATGTLDVSMRVQGTGAEVKAGTTATVNYQLTTFSDKKVLDSSFDRGQPFDVENVGQAPVIDGWNEGIVGLKEKGRRLLIVPPAKGYGQGGQGIKPNETLVFVIDGVKVTSAG